MASVRRIGQRWYARFTGADGRPVERALPRDTSGKRHAQRLADELEANEQRIRLGLKAAPSTETVAAAAARYLEAIRHQRAWKSVESRWRRLIKDELGDVLVQQLPPTQVEELAASLKDNGYSQQTQRHCQMFLSGLYEWLMKDGAADFNPVAKAETVKRPRGNPKAISQADVLRVSDAATFQGLKDLIRALFFTACRPGEMLAVEPRDVDLKARALHIERTVGSDTTKTGRAGWVALPPAAVALFTRLLAERPTGPLFVNASGERLTLRHADRAFKVALAHAGFVSGWEYRCVTRGKRAGCGFREVCQERRSTTCKCGKALVESPIPIDLCLKDMRSSAGTIIAQRAGLLAAQRQLRHSRIDTTREFYTADVPDHHHESIERAYSDGPPSQEQDNEPVVH